MSLLGSWACQWSCTHLHSLTQLSSEAFICTKPTSWPSATLKLPVCSDGAFLPLLSVSLEFLERPRPRVSQLLGATFKDYVLPLPMASVAVRILREGGIWPLKITECYYEPSTLNKVGESCLGPRGPHGNFHPRIRKPIRPEDPGASYNCHFPGHASLSSS